MSTLAVDGPVSLSIVDGLAQLRLTRPDTRNSLDQETADALLAAAAQLGNTPGLRALLITAEGTAFTVGGDIRVFAEASREELPGTIVRMVDPYHRALALFEQLPVPIVTAVQGVAVGGGLGLLHCADIAIAANDSRFVAGFADIGLTGDGGSTWSLPRLIGPRRASAFYLEGRTISAVEAETWGLITRTVPPAELDAHALETATRLAQGPTRAYARVRQLLRRSWEVPFATQLLAEGEGITRAAATADAGAAITAFLAKHRPVFEGN